jgi:hypothetical protein
MTTEKIRIGKTDFTVKPEAQSLTVQSVYPGVGVHSEVIVNFSRQGIKIIEDRSNAPEPWRTIVVPLRAGGFRVETTGAVEDRGLLSVKYEPIDSVTEYADAAALKKTDGRVLSAITNALEALNVIKDKPDFISHSQRKLIETYAKYFVENAQQIS